MMKKLIYMGIIIAFLIVFCSQKASCQKFYIGAKAGYGLPFNDSYLYDNSELISGPDTTIHYISKNFSLGKGFLLNAVFGYEISKNLNVELGVFYQPGTNITRLLALSDNYYVSENLTYTMRGVNWGFTPSLIFSLGKQGWNPYAKVGAVIAFPKFTVKTKDIINIPITNTIKMTEDYSGGTSVGLNASLGVSYDIFQKADVFFEINSTNLVYRPLKKKISSFTINDENQLWKLNTNEKETIYSKDYKVPNTQDPNSPRKEPKFENPFGTIGLNIGFRIKL